MSGLAYQGRDYIKYHRYGKSLYIYKFAWAPDHPHRKKSGHVMAHRLVMERVLGRFLRPDEIVHHINENQLDNRPCNLTVMSRSAHTSHHKNEGVVVTCEVCGTPVHRKRNDTIRRNHQHDYCSRRCFGLGKRKRVTLTCRTCDRDFVLTLRDANRSKGHCSHRCERIARRAKQIAAQA